MNIIQKTIEKFYYFKNFTNNNFFNIILLYFIPIFIYNYYHATVMNKLTFSNLLIIFNDFHSSSMTYIQLFFGNNSLGLGYLFILSFFTFFSTLYFIYFLLKNFQNSEISIKYKKFSIFLYDNILFFFVSILTLLLFVLLFKLLLGMISIFNSLLLNLIFLGLFSFFLVFYLFYINGIYIFFLSQTNKIDNKFIFLLKMNFKLNILLNLNFKMKNFLISYLWYILGLKILLLIISFVLIHFTFIYAIISTFLNFLIDLCFVSFLLKLYIDNKEYFVKN